MNEYTLTDMETKFADVIWASEPIKSTQLVKLCEAEFNWKKSTTYTMLKRLETKELFKNQNGTVTSLINKDEFYSIQSKQFVKESFDNSLPRFVAAFTRNKKLSNKEIEELQILINSHKEV